MKNKSNSLFFLLYFSDLTCMLCTYLLDLTVRGFFKYLKNEGVALKPSGSGFA